MKNLVGEVLKNSQKRMEEKGVSKNRPKRGGNMLLVSRAYEHGDSAWYCDPNPDKPVMYNTASSAQSAMCQQIGLRKARVVFLEPDEDVSGHKPLGPCAALEEAAASMRAILDAANTSETTSDAEVQDPRAAFALIKDIAGKWLAENAAISQKGEDEHQKANESHGGLIVPDEIPDFKTIGGLIESVEKGSANACALLALDSMDESEKQRIRECVGLKWAGQKASAKEKFLSLVKVRYSMYVYAVLMKFPCEMEITNKAKELSDPVRELFSATPSSTSTSDISVPEPWKKAKAKSGWFSVALLAKNSRERGH